MAFIVVDGVRRDVPRNEARVRLRIVSRTERQVVAGYTVEKGENVIEVYRSQVAEMKKLAQTDEDKRLIEAAQQRYQKKLEMFLEKAPHLTERHCPFSVEACFRELTLDRDLPPFEELEELGEEPRRRQTAAA